MPRGLLCNLRKLLGEVVVNGQFESREASDRIELVSDSRDGACPSRDDMLDGGDNGDLGEIGDASCEKSRPAVCSLGNEGLIFA